MSLCCCACVSPLESVKVNRTITYTRAISDSSHSARRQCTDGSVSTLRALCCFLFNYCFDILTSAWRECLAHTVALQRLHLLSGDCLSRTWAATRTRGGIDRSVGRVRAVCDERVCAHTQSSLHIALTDLPVRTALHTYPVRNDFIVAKAGFGCKWDRQHDGTRSERTGGAFHDR